MDPHTRVTETERAGQKLSILHMLTGQGWAETPEGDSFSETKDGPPTGLANVA